MASHVTQSTRPAAKLCRTAMGGRMRSPLNPSASLLNLISRGPGFRVSDFESNRIIGELQFRGAQKIMNQQRSPVRGAVRSVHVYMAMSVNVHFSISESPRLCVSPVAKDVIADTSLLVVLGLVTLSTFRTEHRSRPARRLWVSRDFCSDLPL